VDGSAQAQHTPKTSHFVHSNGQHQADLPKSNMSGVAAERTFFAPMQEEDCEHEYEYSHEPLPLVSSMAEESSASAAVSLSDHSLSNSNKMEMESSEPIQMQCQDRRSSKETRPVNVNVTNNGNCNVLSFPSDSDMMRIFQDEMVLSSTCPWSSANACCYGTGNLPKHDSSLINLDMVPASCGDNNNNTDDGDGDGCETQEEAPKYYFQTQPQQVFCDPQETIPYPRFFGTSLTDGPCNTARKVPSIWPINQSSHETVTNFSFRC
jgi:hypothetical protein